MEQIPTAEAFLKTKNHVESYQYFFISELMIEFAKLHIEATIKACIEDAPSGSSTDTVSYEDVVEALKDSYPLENIK